MGGVTAPLSPATGGSGRAIVDTPSVPLRTVL